MTVIANGTAPTPLGVVRRVDLDVEAPYDDVGAAEEADGTWFDGALALDVPAPVALPVPDPELPPLRLVPPLPEAPRDDPPPTVPLRPVAAAPPVSFAAQRTPRAALPPPGPVATTLSRAILEVIAGDRPVRQLARCASAAVYDELELLVSRRSHRPWAGTLRRVLVCEPIPGVAEVTAVVARGARTGALALRLEGVDGRWQLTACQLV